MDGVTQCAQLVHIAAHSAAGDFQPIGQIGPRPIPAPLKERKQPKKPRGCFQHLSQFGILSRTEPVRNA
jgi:hypothetical protein